MSQYYYHNTHQQHPTPASASGHHGGRNRRAPRLSVSQNQQSHKQFRGVRSMKDALQHAESPSVTNFRRSFELSRTFDLDDDLDFVPTLITESDLAYSGSERSSLASNSPNGSPTQQPQQVVAASYLNSQSPPFLPPSFQAQHSNLKLHQPHATRARNAIPIINPANGQGLTMPSPPQSVSPSVRMQSNLRHQRW